MGTVLNRHVDSKLRSMDDEVDGIPCEDYGIIDYTTACYNSMSTFKNIHTFPRIC